MDCGREGHLAAHLQFGLQTKQVKVGCFSRVLFDVLGSICLDRAGQQRYAWTDRGRVKCRSRSLALRVPHTDFEGAVFCRGPYTMY